MQEGPWGHSRQPRDARPLAADEDILGLDEVSLESCGPRAVDLGRPRPEEGPAPSRQGCQTAAKDAQDGGVRAPAAPAGAACDLDLTGYAKSLGIAAAAGAPDLLGQPGHTMEAVMLAD